MKKREKWDKKRPETKKLVDEIVHGVFVKQGTMVAFPACFPGASLQIPRGESRITALTLGGDGLVYGGTSGARVHLFVGMFQGVTGVVFDLGVAEHATSCSSLSSVEGKFVASVNGPQGCKVLIRDYQPLPYDLIQEWGFSRSPFREIELPLSGGTIIDSAADSSRRFVVGVTDRELYVVDSKEEKGKIPHSVKGKGRIALGSKGGIFGAAGGNLWRFDVSSGDLEEACCTLPDGDWSNGVQSWARDPNTGRLYAADSAGRLYAYDEDSGFSDLLGRVQLAPVGPMSVTFDGRLFGTCGEGISRLFCYDPSSGQLSDIGVAVSVIERRRYGYQFGAAVTGRNGEIFFGEDDDLGHLWLYFPRILPR